jgi:predicted transcriptional regulator
MRSQAIQDFIIPCDEVISPTQTVQEARAKLRKAQIRFLPVEAKGKIVGLLKAELVEAAAHTILGRHLKVASVMKHHPSVVSGDTDLYQVLDDTPNNPYGCTIVQGKNGKVAGVFSSTDALLAFRGILAKKS